MFHFVNNKINISMIRNAQYKHAMVKLKSKPIKPIKKTKVPTTISTFNKNKLTSLNKKPIVIIVTSIIVESIAINFSKFLFEFNIDNKIIYNLTEEICNKTKNNELYLIIHNDALHTNLPKHFILYQIEQLTSNFFTPKYLKELQVSDIIWEFSMRNKSKYDKIKLNKIFYQPMPFYYNAINESKKLTNEYIDNYDVAFYGATNNRRVKILNHISSKFKTNIGFGKICKERDNVIKESKLILNLHYYKDASLEACRINEILQYDKIIISELPNSKDWFNKELYDNLVIFIDEINNDLGNIKLLIEKIEYYLIPENYEKQINIIRKNKLMLHNNSKYFLSKNLLTIKNKLNFNKNKFEYDVTENELYCLHLIETPYRMDMFKNQNFIPNFKIFPAIKFSPGWMGTCYSYTNIIWNAKRCGLNSITVFEDDCNFKMDFYKTYNTIQTFLEKIPKWDIFVGVIANLPPETNIINIYKYKGVTFIEINRMLSMVFNIYNKSSFDTILKWDENDNNIDNNTIDQYLKNKNLSIITTIPFEFRCTNTESTLWGENLYENYNNLFKLSSDILKNKMNMFSGKIIEIK